MGQTKEEVYSSENSLTECKTCLNSNQQVLKEVDLTPDPEESVVCGRFLLIFLFLSPPPGHLCSFFWCSHEGCIEKASSFFFPRDQQPTILIGKPRHKRMGLPGANIPAEPELLCFVPGLSF